MTRVNRRLIGITVIINVIAAIGIVIGVDVSHAIGNATFGGTMSNSNCLLQVGTARRGAGRLRRRGGRR